MAQSSGAVTVISQDAWHNALAAFWNTWAMRELGVSVVWLYENSPCTRGTETVDSTVCEDASTSVQATSGTPASGASGGTAKAMPGASSVTPAAVPMTLVTVGFMASPSPISR